MASVLQAKLLTNKEKTMFDRLHMLVLIHGGGIRPDARCAQRNRWATSLSVSSVHRYPRS